MGQTTVVSELRPNQDLWCWTVRETHRLDWRACPWPAGRGRTACLIAWSFEFGPPRLWRVPMYATDNGTEYCTPRLSTHQSSSLAASPNAVDHRLDGVLRCNLGEASIASIIPRQRPNDEALCISIDTHRALPGPIDTCRPAQNCSLPQTPATGVLVCC